MLEANIPLDEQGLELTAPLADTQLCRAVGRSGIGGRKENQDTMSGTPAGDSVVLTVCDGMGGMNGGQTASSIAAATIVDVLARVPAEQMSTKAITDALARANQAIINCAQATPSLHGMGTTATVLVITPRAAYVAHVGDSRIYQLRRGRKVFRTFDHSRVFEMVALKQMTEEQARTSSFSNVITRALGVWPEVEADVAVLPYRAGDRFVLCSDGIWNVCPEPEVVSAFTAEADTKKQVERLTAWVNGLGHSRGGHHDNLTLLVADMKVNSKLQTSCLRRIGRALAERCRLLKRRNAK